VGSSVTTALHVPDRMACLSTSAFSDLPTLLGAGVRGGADAGIRTVSDGGFNIDTAGISPAWFRAIYRES
jgi:hypothetical protein